MVCPKCGGEMEAKKGKGWRPGLPDVATMFSKVSVEMQVCQKCGYIELYLK